jgi:hypothetical protein
MHFALFYYAMKGQSQNLSLNVSSITISVIYFSACSGINGYAISAAVALLNSSKYFKCYPFLGYITFLLPQPATIFKIVSEKKR